MKIPIRIGYMTFKAEPWRVVGLASGLVGHFCFALSPSFTPIFGEWVTWKFILYMVPASITTLTIIFAKKCPCSRRCKLKPHVCIAVLMITSVYSFKYDLSMSGKPDVLGMVSNAAFALMSLSLSKVVKVGFEVGLLAFFLGFLTVQFMTINSMLILVAIVYGYPLFLIESYSDSAPQVCSEDQHVALDIDTLNTLMFQENKQTKWTDLDNKRFKAALALYYHDKDGPDRWVKMAAMIPGKTIGEVSLRCSERISQRL